jgi:hypothetical protein
MFADVNGKEDYSERATMKLKVRFYLFVCFCFGVVEKYVQ